jgi:hypothetical protein
MRLLMGTQPFPEIQAAQYDSALRVSRYTLSHRVLDSRLDVLPNTVLGDLALRLGVVDLLVRDVDVFPSDVVLIVSLG